MTYRLNHHGFFGPSQKFDAGGFSRALCCLVFPITLRVRSFHGIVRPARLMPGGGGKYTHNENPKQPVEDHNVIIIIILRRAKVSETKNEIPPPPMTKEYRTKNK